MADISKITLPSGSTYDLKDATAREAISKINSFEYLVASDAATTPKGVVWKKDEETITGTLEASSATLHKIYLVPSVNGTNDVYDEYITISPAKDSYVWEMFGNTDAHLSDLGALAYKDSATGSYTPEGTVSQPTFTGNSGDISVSGTPKGSIGLGAGTANYTPAGSLKGGAIGVTLSTADKYVATSANGGGSVTAGSAASCTLPTLEMTVNTETLSLNWTAGSFTANTPTSVTLPSFESATIASGVSAASITTLPTFEGTGVDLEFSGESLTSTGSFTPAGVVSQPSFTGTAKNVTVA